MSLSDGTDFSGLLDNGGNNGAMVDNVDNVENESCFGRLGTMATVSRESGGETISVKNEFFLCWW